MEATIEIQNQIIGKINDVLLACQKDPDFKLPWKEVSAEYKRREVMMDELEAFAKQHNCLIGRIIEFPRGDGQALYVIYRINKKTVKVRLIPWIDGWYDDRLGADGTLELAFAKQKIEGKDYISTLFPQLNT